MRTRPGEVWLADLGLAGKVRPVIILSREDPNPPRQLVIYVPLTTQRRESVYEVDIGRPSFLNEISVANVQGMGAMPVVRLERRLGALSSDVMERIKSALRYALEL